MVSGPAVLLLSSRRTCAGGQAERTAPGGAGGGGHPQVDGFCDASYSHCCSGLPKVCLWGEKPFSRSASAPWPPHPPTGKAYQDGSSHQGLAWETGQLVLTGPRPEAPCDAVLQLPGRSRTPTGTLPRGSAHTLAQGPQGRHPPEAPSHIWALPGKGSADSRGHCAGRNRTLTPASSRIRGALRFRWRWRWQRQQSGSHQLSLPGAL